MDIGRLLNEGAGVMGIFQRLHARLGDLWWYTILLFVAQRFSDVINLFVRLWLVPKYVPQSKLGTAHLDYMPRILEVLKR